MPRHPRKSGISSHGATTTTESGTSIDGQRHAARSSSWTTKRVSQKRQALGYRDLWVFLPFKFQRYEAAVVVLVEDFCDAVVVEIERIPQPSAVIGLRLQQD